jgi:hypothetical protein
MPVIVSHAITGFIFAFTRPRFFVKNAQRKMKRK